MDLPSPSPSPTIEPSNTPKPKSNIRNTPVPPQKKITKNNKLSIHKQSLYKGKQLVGKYSLKNGVLNYKRLGKKTLRYTAVKFVHYTEKGKLVFITKKEAAYEVSLTGKKHRILKKGAKEFVTKKKAKIVIKGAKIATKIRKRNGKCMKL